MTNQTNRNLQGNTNTFETMLSSEQAAVAFNLPFYFFRNPYKRKKLQIPHYYINKLVRYRLAELSVWHAQLGELLAAQAKEAQEQLAAQASQQAKGSEAAHA
jgi:hypothetical protein